MFNGYKTYFMAIAAVLIAVGSTIQNYYNGQPMNIEILISAFIALALLFLRSSQKTK